MYGMNIHLLSLDSPPSSQPLFTVLFGPELKRAGGESAFGPGPYMNLPIYALPLLLRGSSAPLQRQLPAATSCAILVHQDSCDC